MKIVLDIIEFDDPVSVEESPDHPDLVRLALNDYTYVDMTDDESEDLIEALETILGRIKKG